jgi:tryptophanase
MFSYADGATMRPKRRFGQHGRLCGNERDRLPSLPELFDVTRDSLLMGLARRDLEALAKGLFEVLDENYLQRGWSGEYFGNKLTRAVCRCCCRLAGMPFISTQGVCAANRAGIFPGAVDCLRGVR